MLAFELPEKTKVKIRSNGRIGSLGSWATTPYMDHLHFNEILVKDNKEIIVPTTIYAETEVLKFEN